MEFVLLDVEDVITEASSDLRCDKGVFLDGLGIFGSRDGWDVSGPGVC